MITIPTLSELYNDVKTELESELSVSIPLFGKNFLRALAGVQAAKLKIYYLAIGNLQKNIFADTADSELNGGTLERFGRIKIGRNPFPSTAGEYTVQVTGTIGAVIPESTTFKSNDDSTSPGFLFILDAPFTLDGTNEITLRALTTGLDARLSVSDELTITQPVALVDSIATVISEDVIPQSAETLEEYRRKVLEAYRLEAQGGSGSDYRLWAIDVQSVRTVYPYVKESVSNEINLYIEATFADSSDGKGTPTLAIRNEVKDSIEEPTVDRPSRKPLSVYEVHYLDIDVLDIDIEITGFLGIDAATETLIFDTIKAELFNIRPFVSSIDILANKNDIFDINKIISLILSVKPGSVFGAVSLEVNSAPVTTYTFENGEIPNLNSITYV